MQIRVAFLGFEVPTEFVGIWNVADSIPDTRNRPSPDVPQLAGGKAMRIKVGTDLLVVANTRFECPSDDLIRHM